MPHLDQDSVVDDEDVQDWAWQREELEWLRNIYDIEFECLQDAIQYDNWWHESGKYDTEENPLLDLPLRFGPSRNRRVKSTAMDKKIQTFIRRENSRCATKALKTNRKIKNEN